MEYVNGDHILLVHPSLIQAEIEIVFSSFARGCPAQLSHIFGSAHSAGSGSADDVDARAAEEDQREFGSSSFRVIVVVRLVE